MTREQGLREVFLSYASADASIANDICEALERERIGCWIAPRDVTPGEPYADAIVQAMDAAKVVVLVLSQSAATSPHVLREVERATSNRRPVISLRIDASPMPASLQYFLNTTQWLDATKEGVVDALPKLVDAVRRHLGQISGSETPQPVATHGTNRASPRAGTRWMLAGGLTVLALVFAYFFTDPFATNSSTVATVAAEFAPAATPIPTRSIAVLPFTDMSETKDQEYLADGMAEEILNLLAQVPDLLVPARTSSFYFKGKPTRIPEIARELGVVHVLEGSVRRAGDRVRVTAQLIRADNGYHLWSETYDRDLEDIFAVQDDIARAVVEALQIKLLGGELSRQRGGTRNLEAYQLYLRATSAVYENSRPSLDAAADYLDRAIKLDPEYGLAWSQLAQTVLAQTDIRILNSKEGYARARQLAQHALQLSPDLAVAHAWVAYVDLVLDWDWTAAAAEVGRALAIDPTNPDALQIGGVLSNVLGHWEEAHRQLRTSLVRDPLNPFTVFNVGNSLYGQGRFAEAEAAFRRVNELAPRFSGTPIRIAMTLLAQGKPEAALVSLQQETREDVRLTILPILLQAVGRTVEADEAFEKQIESWADRDAFYVAATYAYRADRGRAIEMLDRAFEQRSSSVIVILVLPFFRDDPNYRPFLRKMNLVE